jgi:hypothetical protein
MSVRRARIYPRRVGRRRFGFAALVTAVLCAVLVVGAVVLAVRAWPGSSLPPDPRPATLADQLAAAQGGETWSSGNFCFGYLPLRGAREVCSTSSLSRRRQALSPEQEARLRPAMDRAVAAVVRAEAVPPWYCNLLPFCDRDSPRVLLPRIRDELARAGLATANVWIEQGVVTFTIERADGCLVGDQYAVIRTGFVSNGGGC